MDKLDEIKTRVEAESTGTLSHAATDRKWLLEEVYRLQGENASIEAERDDYLKIAEEYRNKINGQGREQSVSTIPCCVCGGKVIEFTVPSDIWNFVMRPNGKETDKEYLCWDCWNKALRKRLEELQRREQAAVERLCYSCHNYNPASEIKHSKSCDICPWHGPRGGEESR